MLEHFFAKYSLESPLRQYLLGQAERVEAEMDAVNRELAPTLQLKRNLDKQVRSIACRQARISVWVEGERAVFSTVSEARTSLPFAQCGAFSICAAFRGARVMLFSWRYLPLRVE